MGHSASSKIRLAMKPSLSQGLHDRQTEVHPSLVWFENRSLRKFVALAASSFTSGKYDSVPIVCKDWEGQGRSLWKARRIDKRSGLPSGQRRNSSGGYFHLVEQERYFSFFGNTHRLLPVCSSGETVLENFVFSESFPHLMPSLVP